MAKIAVITDLHLDSHKGDLRFWNYFLKFYDNVFFPYLDENNIKDILILGDVIDNRKIINFSTLRNIRLDFFNKLNQYNVNIILGNHDVYYKTTNEVNSLELLFDNYQNVNIIQEPFELSLHGTNFLLLPWINSTNKDEFMQCIENSQADILCAHLEITNCKMIKGINCEHGLDADIFSKFKQVWSGHFHHRNVLNNINYIGNPYELYWYDCGDDRGFSVFDSDTQVLDFIKNPYSIYAKIIYDDVNNNYDSLKFIEYSNKFVKIFIKEKTNIDMYDKLIENLYECGVHDVKVIDNTNEFNVEETSIENISVKSTIDIFNEYIDKVEVNTSKSDLKSEIEELYNEAALIIE